MRELLRPWSLALMVSAMIACAPHVEGGGGGAGAGGSSTGGSGGATACPPPDPGMCAPSQECVNGVQQNGGANCVDGQWVCTTTLCTVGCTVTYQYCANNLVTELCCSPGDPCETPPSYCDLGNGYCTEGPCPLFDAGTTCGLGALLASQYDQTCTADSDCAAVYQGPLCSDCFCPNAAINAMELADYSAVLASANQGNTCNCPASPPPVCSAGVCTLP